MTQSSASLYLSNNGLDWGESNPGTSIPCLYLTFGGDVFAGVGDDAVTFYYDEEDGWTQGYHQSFQDLYHIAYGADRFVAVGSGITYSNNIAGGWRTTSGSTGAASVVAFGGGKFVAINSSGSTVYTSEDGMSWTSAPASGAPSGMKDMTFDDGKFVAVGGGRAAVSSDGGTSWTVSPLNENDKFRAVKYGNGEFMALGEYGSVYTSANGSSWTKQTAGRLMSYKQIVYGGSVYVAVGDSGVSVSRDGRDWAGKGGGRGLQGVAYGAGRFVAVGDSGAIFSSADGEQWSDHSRPGFMFTSVAFGADAFIAGGRTEIGKYIIFVSTDGQNWVEESPTGWSATYYPATLCYGNGKFFAGGGSVSGSSNGVLKYAEHSAGDRTPGKFWTDAQLPDEAKSYRITSITYANNDRFVALGTTTIGTGVVLSSTDGVSWNVMPAPSRAKSATYGKGYYLVAADSGNIYESQNGQTWAPHRKATNRNLNTIFFGNDIALAAGASGAMLYLPGDRISVRHTPASGRSPRHARGMSMDNARKSPVVTLSFTPDRPGTIAVYSLTGRQLYKKRVAAGERAVSLPPGRITSNGSVIVKYTGAGRTESKRFQMVQ